MIGTNASPFDPGTAYDTLSSFVAAGYGGLPGAWGYVTGGVGMVSFYLCDIARKAGATSRRSARAENHARRRRRAGGRGNRFRFRGGFECRRSHHAPLAGRSRRTQAGASQVESIPAEGCTLKLNVLLKELPDFLARPGTCEAHHKGQINTPLTRPEWKAAYQSAREGRFPERLWTELYFQSVYDRSVVPEGLHMMSVFAQYVPYSCRRAIGNCASRSSELALRSIGRFCTNMRHDAVEAMGPPDIERKVGLTGRIHFPRRMPSRVYVEQPAERQDADARTVSCGACTHPGGSVIAVNGRNAATAVLRVAKCYLVAGMLFSAGPNTRF